ncbi:hypothetical protein [Nocardia cyriacigeorgica]|nr:hypothetical protein [Nocardia cyriacigeorgica]MBF6435468.1 hypothetical protein [Nocardia cyriacigeorgica]MBF6454453.1 hypothetical protein [Nocardia cyriacigeorgica]MBF6481926.1 hypothetical protein [Nocardia cyriacigeorgica]MBF6552347.1 hypothetical protein [Nocardia cyriacigeorgica]
MTPPSSPDDAAAAPCTCDADLTAASADVRTLRAELNHTVVELSAGVDSG